GARRAEALRCMYEAVDELDPLADAVRAAAEDDDLLRVARRRLLIGLAPRRVVVVRCGLDLAGARVDAPVRRADAVREPRGACLRFRRVRGRRDLRIGDPESLEPQPVGCAEPLDRVDPEERFLDAE